MKILKINEYNFLFLENPGLNKKYLDKYLENQIYTSVPFENIHFYRISKKIRNKKYEIIVIPFQQNSAREENILIKELISLEKFNFEKGEYCFLEGQWCIFMDFDLDKKICEKNIFDIHEDTGIIEKYLEKSEKNFFIDYNFEKFRDSLTEKEKNEYGNIFSLMELTDKDKQRIFKSDFYGEKKPYREFITDCFSPRIFNKRVNPVFTALSLLFLIAVCISLNFVLSSRNLQFALEENEYTSRMKILTDQNRLLGKIIANTGVDQVDKIYILQEVTQVFELKKDFIVDININENEMVLTLYSANIIQLLEKLKSKPVFSDIEISGAIRKVRVNDTDYDFATIKGKIVNIIPDTNKDTD